MFFKHTTHLHCSTNNFECKLPFRTTGRLVDVDSIDDPAYHGTHYRDEDCLIVLIDPPLIGHPQDDICVVLLLDYGPYYVTHGIFQISHNLRVSI